MRKNLNILFLFFLFACSQPEDTERIKIATLKGPSSIGMIQMIDSIKKAEKPNIDITIYNEPIQVRKLMLENEVDIAVLPTTMAAILYNKGLPYQVAAIPVWGTLYLFGRDTTVTSWTDLKGKEIYLMAKGMTPDVLFKFLLTQNGINPDKDVTLNYSFPSHIDLANAVAANQCELAVISEPLVSLVMQKNKSVFPIFDLNSEWQKVNKNIPLAQTSLLVHKDFARSYTKELRKILDAYKSSTNWVNAKHEEAAELIVKYDILPNTDIAKSSIPRCNLRYEEITKIKDQVKNYIEIFYQMNPNIVGNKIPDDNFYLN